MSEFLLACISLAMQKTEIMVFSSWRHILVGKMDNIFLCACCLIQWFCICSAKVIGVYLLPKSLAAVSREDIGFSTQILFVNQLIHCAVPQTVAVMQPKRYKFVAERWDYTGREEVRPSKVRFIAEAKVLCNGQLHAQGRGDSLQLLFYNKCNSFNTPFRMFFVKISRFCLLLYCLSVIRGKS